MNLNEPVDLYCERMAAGLWAEPLNTATNLAFLLAALLVARQANLKDNGVRLLTILLAVIGIGSFLFHYLGVRWAQFADVIPIVIFQLLAVYLTLRRVMRFAPWLSIMWVAIFVASGISLAKIETLNIWMNGSQA